jgi:hypothetical protein|mmetsp:Transcript_8679/g.32459  ORF Transcript_8679/g.32459 Transcript_8679/m.32459 type:complete len:91 (+) Transcript_8679:5151-5423(+)
MLYGTLSSASEHSPRGHHEGTRHDALLNAASRSAASREFFARRVSDFRKSGDEKRDARRFEGTNDSHDLSFEIRFRRSKQSEENGNPVKK